MIGQPLYKSSAVDGHSWHEWDNGELSEDDLIAIKKELEEQL